MTYERNKMLGLLYSIFQAEEYTWGVEPKTPSFSEIEEAVEGLEASALECRGTAQSCRIMVCYDKETQSYEYYLNLGGF